MRVALLSDIHANPDALRAVLRDLRERGGCDQVFFLGDLFGYYPWGRATWEIFSSLKALSILGNHDQLLLDLLNGQSPPAPVPEYVPGLIQQGRDLPSAALDWLRAQPRERVVRLGSLSLRMVHGTPADALEGRWYPDNTAVPEWLPGGGEILALGHTHYPIERRLGSGGVLLNPGSVGQPRDGNPAPSWILLEVLESGEIRWELRRVDYDRATVMTRLREIGWPPRFIAALDKKAPGPLKPLNPSHK